MNKKFSFSQAVFPVFLFLAVISLFGCARYPVRHLTSDASLIVPNQTTKKDVIAYMGFPNQKVTAPGEKEVWYYVESKKSLMRKTPYIGNSLGHEEYQAVIITYSGDIVDTCTFRLLDEEGFAKTGITAGEQSDLE